MKRFCLLAALMLFCPSAHAGNGISFSIGGHRIQIDSVRCRSVSCVSVSGVSRRDDGGDKGRQAKPAPPAPATTGTISAVAAESNPPRLATASPPALPPVAAPPPSPTPMPRIVTAPPPPVVVIPPAPPPQSPVARPAEPVRPAQQATRVSRVAEDEPADGTIGDWQTETDSLVRIRLCGRALCGYALDKETRDLGEAVLINMKPKKGAQWSGNVYSHDSGNTHYGTMETKGANTLRVEACAFGGFYCTGTNWTRASPAPRRMITQQQIQSEPRS